MIRLDESKGCYIDDKGLSYVRVTSIVALTPKATDFSKVRNQAAVEKAAQRGTLIHHECDEVIRTGESGLSLTSEYFKDELFPVYKDWEYEVIVGDRDGDVPYAGSIDFVCRYGNKILLIDLKTGGHNTVDYQLSLYKRAFCKNRGIAPEDVLLYCIDAKNEEDIKFFSVKQIPDEWLDTLLTCFAEGKDYHEPRTELTTVPDKTLARLDELQQTIVELKDQMDSLTLTRDKLKEELYKAMLDAGVNSFSYGRFTASVVNPQFKEEFNKEACQKEHPELDLNQYMEEVVSYVFNEKTFKAEHPEEYLDCIDKKQTKKGYLTLRVREEEVADEV